MLNDLASRACICVFLTVPSTLVAQENDDPVAIAGLQRIGTRLERDEKGLVWSVEFVQAPDASLAHLKGLPHLRQVKIGRTSGIGDAGLAHLKPLKQLRVITCVGNQRITDEGLIHLAKLENLVGLFLLHTDVSDDGLKHLTSLKNLRRLMLNRTKVTEEGVRVLQDALPNAKITF